MSDNLQQAFFDGYDGLEIAIGPGLTLKRKCLPLDRAAHYIRLEQGFSTEIGQALTAEQQELRTACMLEFAKELELPAIPIGEFWRVYNCFFFPRVPCPSPNGQPTSTPAPLPAGTNS